jgi:hypothetical protein
VCLQFKKLAISFSTKMLFTGITLLYGSSLQYAGMAPLDWGCVVVSFTWFVGIAPPSRYTPMLIAALSLCLPFLLIPDLASRASWQFPFQRIQCLVISPSLACTSSIYSCLNLS